MTPFQSIREASCKRVPPQVIDSLLVRLAERLTHPSILAANERDLARMERTNPLYDRLQLTEKRVQGMADQLIAVSKLPSPLGKVLEQRTLPNGLELSKVSVPLGVVGVVYEARPNVTVDVFALCLKSGNCTILKGGSDAYETNCALMEQIRGVLEEFNLPKELAYLMPPDRAQVKELLEAAGYVDVIIPRGSDQLIRFVRENAKVPVIETGAGIVHTYLDSRFNLEKAQAIILNAKTRRVSVCNALDTLIVHQNALPLLAQVVQPLSAKQVEIYADAPAYRALKGHYPHLVEKENFGIEFLDYKMSIKTVASLEEALEHIHTYSSRHSEAIISDLPENCASFLDEVDAAAVYANTSTAFTDGGEFGLGAEIGISTQKLHARGPMGLQELTSYKWIIKGNGQVRNG